MKKILFSFLFIFVFFSLTLSAQNTFPCLAMEVHTTPVSNYQLPDGSEYFSDSTVFGTQMLISLYDTVDISYIHVKVGRAPDATDVIDATYDFNTYRDGYNISLTLGNYASLLHYYSEIKLEHADGSLTDTITFSR
jgi:hypothetical protein